MSAPARTIAQWTEAFGTMPGPRNAMNCAYLVVEALQSEPTRGPRNKDYEADEIANAMLAFKRIGADDGEPIS